jgi:hypothetical protein
MSQPGWARRWILRNFGRIPPVRGRWKVDRGCTDSDPSRPGPSSSTTRPCVTGPTSSFPGKEEQPRVFPSQDVGFNPMVRQRPGEGCSLTKYMALHVQLHLCQPPARCRSCCYMYGAIRTPRRQLCCDGLVRCVAYLLKDPALRLQTAVCHWTVLTRG